MDDTYAYDAAGSRMMRTESGETVAYTLGTGDRLASWTGGAYAYDDNWQVIADLDEQGSVVVSYVWGYVDSQNDVVARWRYDAWGNVIAEDVSVPALARIRYRFQGREWSAATGLINFRMRWYDTETGRWLSKDPIGLSGGLNLYAFCGNDPVCKNDFLGLMHNVPIPGTDYEGRVEVQADKRNSRQGDSMLWHVDIQEPDTGKKVWSGVFDGSGEYVREREGCGGCPRGNGPTRGGMGIRPRGGGLLNKPGGGIRDPWMLVSPYLL